jgi:hypothetical protein
MPSPPSYQRWAGEKTIAASPKAHWPRRKPFALAPRLVRAMGAFGDLLGFGQL